MKTLLLAFAALLLSISTSFAAVNANTASVEELQVVAGIGPTIAQRIVDERRKGPYKGLDDIQARVKGIGETSIRKMAAAGLTVSGGRTKPESRDGDTFNAKDGAKVNAKVAPKSDPKLDAKEASKVAPNAVPKAMPKVDARP